MDKDQLLSTGGRICKDSVGSIVSSTEEVVLYHRTTSRISDLTLTFMEDGVIGLKRGKELLTTTADELYIILELANHLRDRPKEIALIRARQLDEQIKHTNNGFNSRLEDLKSQRAKLKDEHGV